MDVIASILETAKDGNGLKTQIMYKANLSYAQLSEYLCFLLGSGLIKRASDGDREIYVVAEKGYDFLRRHGELIQLLKE